MAHRNLKGHEVEVRINRSTREVLLVSIEGVYLDTPQVLEGIAPEEVERRMEIYPGAGN